MARRTARVRFARPAPKTKMWIGAGVGEQTITGSAVQLLFSLSAGALLLRPFTVLRSRMLVCYESDQKATTERSFGAFGVIVVIDQATAIGATAVPDPGTIGGDPEADWFIHQTVATSLVHQTNVGFDPRAQY